jgi:transcription elongation factor Elf1
VLDLTDPPPLHPDLYCPHCGSVRLRSAGPLLLDRWPAESLVVCLKCDRVFPISELEDRSQTVDHSAMTDSELEAEWLILRALEHELAAEHAAVSLDPDDIEGHEAHRERLRAHRERIRAFRREIRQRRRPVVG